MMLRRTIETLRCPVSPLEYDRINRRFDRLAQRLSHHPDPIATLVLERHDAQRRVTADLRLTFGHRAPTLVSHQSAETADLATKLAIEDIERQLERRLAKQRGEPAYGVPSRREPEALRPGRGEQAGSAAS